MSLGAPDRKSALPFITDQMRALFQGQGPLGLAVSGGGDSVALLHLARQFGRPLAVATVDHNLRQDSRAEAEWVAGRCKELNIKHHILTWSAWDQNGNLQDQARRARYRLLAKWADVNGIETIALGHTRDDVAETFLMRLGRGAGIDGLCAMQSRRSHLKKDWVRPLLDMGRANLRGWLESQGLAWLEDSSNDDSRFERIRFRKATAALEGLGLDAPRLMQVAVQLGQAREALAAQAHNFALKWAKVEGGDVVFDRSAYLAAPLEILRRSLSAAIMWVSCSEYGPRGPTLKSALVAMQAGQSLPLGGCRLLVDKSSIRVTRELKAAQSQVLATSLWDQRWQFLGPDLAKLKAGPLGAAGLLKCTNWRESGFPRVSLLASPALWCKDELMSAPFAGNTNNYSLSLASEQKGFFLSLLSY